MASKPPVLAFEMPDCCDTCDDGRTYYPFRWHRGWAHYCCRRLHQWTCGWGHEASGYDDSRIGVSR